ncbi:ubiquitin-protein ligase peroxin 12 [Emydomyces testavorans]|uniref:Peroxisome assembly protein 12 n=1 Tax=Emydomyces testavorans TaxID=2070801 RepID=A0AAF0DQM8_9EURO|nr:ubiquitin-protein ligase peroxin 12 [Emydomyces testavorans]
MEYMSALQGNFDDFKPSLFELLSEHQLSALIPPSLRYLLAVATHRHPRYLLRILNAFDEVYALLSLIIERYYLRTFGGSFTEHFYSLKRERVLEIKNGEVPRAQLGATALVRDTLKLRNSDIWRNLVVMVGLPYLKRKLDEGYDIHAAPQAALAMGGGGGPRYNPADDLPHNPTIRQRLMFYYKWFLRNVYPSVNAAYYVSLLAFNLAYLFDNTKYSSPFLWLIGTRIRRLSLADHKAIALATQSKPVTTAHTRPGASRLGMLSPRNVYPQVLGSLKFLLPASIFALKFLEWWHASDFSRQLSRKATEALDLPVPVVSGMPPPPASKPSLPSALKQSKHNKPTTLPTITTTTTSTTTPSTTITASPTTVVRRQPPTSSTSYLPIFTVPLPQPDPSAHDTQNPCPICLHPLVNPTACQTGYVFCYSCVFRWLNGEHDRQLDFMNGTGGGEWDDDPDADGETESEGGHVHGKGHMVEKSADGEEVGRSRVGKWESGKGRCPVTGRRVLGGTEGLRRVLV